jgi:hypothetical protein
MPKGTLKRQVTIFYSYAHADYKMQVSLHKALTPLKRSRKFKLVEWYDGRIRPGCEWEPATFENLKRSNVILLLLSPAFIDSRYCYEKELKWALRCHNERTALVIPVVLKEVAWRDRKFSPYQAIPRGKKGIKPVIKWRPRSMAWKEIRKQLRKEIQEFLDGGPVTDVRSMSRRMQNMTEDEVKRVGASNDAVKKKFDSVMQFWAEREHFREGDLIQLSGTFSEFAPLLIGHPKGKRMLHREFRVALEKNPKLAQKKVKTLNACMSISAGQMVWRDRHATEGGLNCGLYESIVRNSIPVYVTRQYYETKLRNIAIEEGADTFEASVIARVTKRDMSSLKEYFTRYGIKSFISKTVVDHLCRDSIGLLVDGEMTSISPKGRAKYLDGDIWIAGESNGNEFFVTVFLDVGDPKDREEALMILRKDLEEFPGSPRLIGQYDEAGELEKAGFDVAPDVEPIEKIFKYGFEPS